MRNGFYSFRYYGPFGQGHGHFAVRDGELSGLDVGNGQYIGGIFRDGSSNRETVYVELIPPGDVPLVTDGRIHGRNRRIVIQFDISDDDLGKPMALELAEGPVTVTIEYRGEESECQVA